MTNERHDNKSIEIYRFRKPENIFVHTSEAGLCLKFSKYRGLSPTNPCTEHAARVCSLYDNRQLKAISSLNVYILCSMEN